MIRRFDHDGENPCRQEPTASEFQVTTLEKSTNKNRGYKSQQLLVWVWLSMSMMMAVIFFFFFFLMFWNPSARILRHAKSSWAENKKNTIMFSRNSIDREVSSQVSRFIYSWWINRYWERYQDLQFQLFLSNFLSSLVSNSYHLLTR